ncbi:MAG: hypothetical protein J1F68_06075 [Clostridiales bacterium]|nr:hypothetical protein [Clostridiales bacterium]
MKFIATFTPTIKIFLYIIAVISLVGIVVGILPLAGVHLEITTGQASLLISVCSLTLIVSIMLATIHYKVDKTHVRINIAFIDMLSGRIRLDNILNIVIKDGKMYISYLWKGPDPVIALIAIKPKRYEEFKELLMSKNKNIVFYEYKDGTTDSEQQ